MIKKIFIFGLLFLGLGIFVGCKNATDNYTISFEENSIALEVGEEKTLLPVLSKTGLSLDWASEKPEIASVDNNGKIKGLAKGNTKITVTIKDTKISASINVTINDKAEINFQDSEVVLEVEETHTVKFNLSDSTKTLNWTSSDTNVATVENGVVTTLAVGTTTITATIKDTEITASLKITVIPVVDITEEELTLKPGKKHTLEFTAVEGQVFDWSSDNQEVVTVVNGVITAVAKGSAKVAIKLNNEVLDEVNVIVEEYTISIEQENINIKEQETVTLTVLTNDVDAVVTWKSSNTSLATVSEGVVTAIKGGTVTITASIGNYVSTSITIEIEALPTITIEGDDTVLIKGMLKLKAIDNLDSFGVGAQWSSSDPKIATVDKYGNVKGVSYGEVTITATSFFNSATVSKVIKVEYRPLSSLNFQIEGDKRRVGELFKITPSFDPIEVDPVVTWISSDEEIASINEEGFLVAHKPGEVMITGVPRSNSEMAVSKLFMIYDNIDPIELFKSFHNDTIIAKEIKVIGFEHLYTHNLLTSVSNYSFNSITVKQLPIPEGPKRGQLLHSIEYVVIHDTGAASATSTALANGNWAANPASEVSWHYTVDDKEIYQHLTDYEYGWHAGDGGRAYAMTQENNDSGIFATTFVEPVVTVSEDGFYELNGIKSKVAVPKIAGRTATTADLTSSGIRVVIGSNGNWWIGNTYYNSTYKVIANHGGGRSGIGIESAIYDGSDIYMTWHNLAKHTSNLLKKYQLTTRDVRQHNYFSGKDCPQTMRTANMWDNFMNLVAAEYAVATDLYGYNITFTSHNLEYVNNVGRVIKLPQEDLEVSYTVNISKGDYNESVTLKTILPAFNKIVKLG